MDREVLSSILIAAYLPWTPGYGIVAFRDVNGLRPLILGERVTEHGTDYIVASESVALDVLGYRVVGDIEPGMLRLYGMITVLETKPVIDVLSV